MSENLPGDEIAALEMHGSTTKTTANDNEALDNEFKILDSDGNDKDIMGDLYTTCASGGCEGTLSTINDVGNSNGNTWSEILPNFKNGNSYNTALGGGKYKVGDKTYIITTEVRPKHAHVCDERYTKYLEECTFQENSRQYCCKNFSDASRCNEVSSTRETTNCIPYGSSE